MKCIKCGTEIPGTVGKNQHCPICGEVLTNDIPYQQVVDALNMIVGLEKDGAILIQMIRAFKSFMKILFSKKAKRLALLG